MKQKSGCLKIALVLILVSFMVCGFTIWGLTTVYYGLSVSPNGETLVVTTPSAVTMYRLSDGKVLHQEDGRPYGLQDYQGEFSYIAWSPDGSNLAIGKLYNGIWIWDARTWELLTDRNGDINARNEPSFAWSPDGQKLALGNGNGEMWIWSKSDNSWAKETETQKGLVSIAWTSQGNY